jgi:plastocyanin
MTRPDEQRRRLRICMHAGVVSLAIALTAAIAPLALGVTTPVHGTTHASGSSHHGKCARRARRHERRHRRCSVHQRDGAKAPTPALALTAPAGPTLQPVAPIALVPPASVPPASVPPAPAGSAPASEGAKPGGEGDGEAGEGVEPPSIPHVQVSAVEYAFTLSRTTVPAGKVIFQFVNNGQDEHNLKIAPSEGPLAGSFANTPSKGIGDLQLEIQPGVYTLFCSLPTHEQKGMKATLTVE